MSNVGLYFFLAFTSLSLCIYYRGQYPENGGYRARTVATQYGLVAFSLLFVDRRADACYHSYKLTHII